MDNNRPDLLHLLEAREVVAEVLNIQIQLQHQEQLIQVVVEAVEYLPQFNLVVREDQV